MHANENRIKIINYNISNNFKDLIGAIGGYLGLFLGWSVLSFVRVSPSWVKTIQQHFMYIDMIKI